MSQTLCTSSLVFVFLFACGVIIFPVACNLNAVKYTLFWKGDICSSLVH